MVQRRALDRAEERGWRNIEGDRRPFESIPFDGGRTVAYVRDRDRDEDQDDSPRKP